MLTLEELWISKDKEKKLKVRFIDWNHKWKYFEIHSYEKDKKKLKGKLCTGETVSYPCHSRHWMLYETGDEHMARAV